MEPDSQKLEYVKLWLQDAFRESGAKVVPGFECTRRTVSHLHDLATSSRARTRTAKLLAEEMRDRTAEYRCETARLNELLRLVGIEPCQLSRSGRASVATIAGGADALDLRATDEASFALALADTTLRTHEAEDRHLASQQASRASLAGTRSAITQLGELKRVAAACEMDAAAAESQLLYKKSNLRTLADKDSQYQQELLNFKQRMLQMSGYQPHARHSALTEMASRLATLEASVASLQAQRLSYKDLPPDGKLASLMIQEKRNELGRVQQQLEDSLASLPLCD
eukprot:jgi/Mesvir1/25942/Mv20936-RA.1